MARRRSNHRTKGRSCTGKPRHATEQHAKAAARRVAARSGCAPARVEWYPCQFCSGYHVGHSARRKT